jgi:transcriptional regulator with GAF, ATPase, and Fis domain
MNDIQNFSLALIAQSEVMRTILSRIDTIAASDHSVLLVGETGVGKELFAEYIHRISQRAGQAIVKVGLSSLPHELLESELFGHEKGSFTNASSEKPGLFELADRGTIFLDDIDDVPLQVQTKLLRILESRELMRVGGTTALPIDVRVISASKVDLKELVDQGAFRADLYYRLNVIPIVIPPLRNRTEDIPLLIDHFIKRFSPDASLKVSREALDALTAYPWPGNVRELRNVIQRITLFAREIICIDDLPAEIRNTHPVDLIVKACNRCLSQDGMTYEQVVSCLEVNLIRQALTQSNGNQVQAARILRLAPSTFRDKLRKFNLESSGK